MWHNSSRLAPSQHEDERTTRRTYLPLVARSSPRLNLSRAVYIHPYMSTPTFSVIRADSGATLGEMMHNLEQMMDSPYMTPETIEEIGNALVEDNF